MITGWFTDEAFASLTKDLDGHSDKIVLENFRRVQRMVGVLHRLREEHAIILTVTKDPSSSNIMKAKVEQIVCQELQLGPLFSKLFSDHGEF